LPFSWLYINGTDPDGLLDWLIGRLQNAEDNNIKVKRKYNKD